MHNSLLMKVSIAIVTFNSAAVIKDCLTSVEKIDYDNFEILIYDNASIDNTIEIIESFGNKRIKIVRSYYNRGFGFGLNRLAEISTGEILASLNPDTVVDKEWIKNAVKHFVSEDVGMVSSRILFKDNPDLIDSAGHLLYPDGINRGRGHKQRVCDAFLKTTDVAFPSGSAGFYRRELFLKFGGIDESFFLFGDDTDIGIKFQLNGYRCIYEPDSIVYHIYSHSTGKYSDIKAYFVERNRVRILLKYFPTRLIGWSALYTLKRAFYHNLSAIIGKGDTANYLKNGSIFRLYTLMLMAYLDTILNLQNILRTRKEISKKIRNRKIGQLLQRFPISAREIALNDYSKGVDHDI
ncbi:MAG: glycosyltransferase [Deltaproteobacteria bacterium]|nr:glycosyltransferase [Deltaproteobacteria bacterium]